MSSSASSRKSHLQVLRGGRRVSAYVAGIRVVVAREDDPPFGVDAVAVEDDTWLALGTPADVVSSPGHPVRVMTRVWEAQPEEPGTVLVKRGSPLRLHAVVHDLNADPSWNEAWVRAALSGIFEEAARHRLRALRLPLLATKHGSLPAKRFMALLREALVEHAASVQQHLQGIWLVRDGESGADLLATLVASEQRDDP